MQALGRRALQIHAEQDTLLPAQSFTFHGGKLEEEKYLKSFPFPYYILVRDAQLLPQTLASLLSQWFQFQSSN